MPTPENPLPRSMSTLAVDDSPSAVAKLGSSIGVSHAGLRRFRRLWTMWMVLATSLPYLWNFFTRPPGSRYAWILPPFRDDAYGYMAWTQQAAHGALLFKLKFTA